MAMENRSIVPQLLSSSVPQFNEFSLSRRKFLATSASTFAAGLVPLIGQERRKVPAGARFERMVPFAAAARPGAASLGRLLGAGLDARLFTDLSLVDEDKLITPTDRFFIRTSAPEALPAARSWTIEIDGLVAAPQSVTIDALKRLVAPAGTHVIECAGNTDPANYGLMSAARWDGIPLLSLIERARPARDASYVLVSGLDDPGPSSTSVPECSWIFSRADLEQANAFLAVAMNGAELPRDHGFPVRLVVPGWYGCASVKWVNRVTIVRADAAPTSQMVEYARRTHQDESPKSAAEYAPAAIDTAAIPIRVERWLQNGRPLYRVVGVMWGGTKPTNDLRIRFAHTEPWVPVDDSPLPSSTTMWTMWSHWWRPSVARRYEIVLKVGDPSIRTRRLNLFYYVREIDIEVV